MKKNEINNQKTEQLNDDYDSDRRKILKSSACVIGACYLAPTTLNMLMATRATAQSAAPDPCANGEQGTITFQVTGFGAGEVFARYTNGDCIIEDFDVTVTPDIVVPVGGSLYIFKVDRVFDMSVNGGGCTNGRSSRIRSDTSITIIYCT